MFNRRSRETVLCEFEELLLIQLILAHPWIYLRELQQLLYHSTSCWVDASTICRTVHRLGMTRQHIMHVSLLRSEVKQAEFWAEISAFEPSMMLWVDETGCDRRNSLRKYGYGIRGQPPQEHTLILRGKRYSAIGILSTEGVEDVYITDWYCEWWQILRICTAKFAATSNPFNGQNPNSIVILDNVSIHHLDQVVELITSVGALIRFLPPYSPDMNPIEELFAEIKQYLRANHLFFNTAMSSVSIVLMAFNLAHNTAKIYSACRIQLIVHTPHAFIWFCMYDQFV